MDKILFRCDFRALIGVPVVVIGLSVAAVSDDCIKKLSEVVVDYEGKSACVLGNFKLFDPGQSLVTVSGSQVQANIVQTFDAIDSAQAVINLSNIWLQLEAKPLSSFDYSA